MKKTTEELFHILKNTRSINSYIENQAENLSASSLEDYLAQLLSDKALSKSECIQKSGLDRTYCYQIFSGAKKPSRDKLLALCIGMELTTDEVQQLLKATGYPPLYPRHQRDSVILFCLNRRLSLSELNELLFEMDMPLLQ